MDKELYRQGRYRIIRRSDTGGLQLNCTIEGKRYRLSAGKDLREAKRRLESFRAEIDSGWRPREQTPDSWQKVATRIWRRHKQSAQDRRIPFDVTAAEVYQLMLINSFHCCISGITFSRAERMGAHGLSDPWAPSIDRIDNRQGYLADNIRVVCVAANIGMNAWGYDTLLRLARGVIRKADALVPEPLTSCIVTSPNIHLVSG